MLRSTSLTLSYASPPNRKHKILVVTDLFFYKFKIVKTKTTQKLNPECFKPYICCSAETAFGGTVGINNVNVNVNSENLKTALG